MARETPPINANPRLPNPPNALVPLGDLEGREVVVQQNNGIPRDPAALVEYFYQMTNQLMAQYGRERDTLVDRINLMQGDLNQQREVIVNQEGQNVRMHLQNGQKTRELEARLQVELEQRNALAQQVAQEQAVLQRIQGELQIERQQRQLLVQQVNAERRGREVLGNQVLINQQQRDLLEQQVQVELQRVNNLAQQVQQEKNQRENLQAQVALDGQQIQGLVQQVVQVNQQKDQLAAQAKAQLKAEQTERLKILETQLEQTSQAKQGQMKDYGTLVLASEGVGTACLGPVGFLVGGIGASLGGAFHYLPKVDQLDRKETELKAEIAQLQRLLA
jgi:hypothetical protein